MNTSSKKSVIIVTGPTAVGKTAVAIRLAQHFNTEIISADSRQCFKEMNIGVARPEPEELKQVKHHFIASHSIHETITAAVFEHFAMQKVKELFQKHAIVIMVGGTGLYIKAFCEGLDVIPEIESAIRQKIIEAYEQKGIGWLQEQLQQKDPAFAVAGEMQNPQRMMRALEVVESTGQSILLFRKGGKAKRDFNIIKIGLEMPKEELKQNINTRVDKMMQYGLLEEVKRLMPYRHLNALQTVGYKELFDYYIPRLRLEKLSEKQFIFSDNVVELNKAIELIKQNTRQYSKRQMTWFRKDAEIKWFNPLRVEEIIDFLTQTIHSSK
jgi:tRNA dimethylallyltransferase